MRRYGEDEREKSGKAWTTHQCHGVRGEETMRHQSGCFLALPQGHMSQSAGFHLGVEWHVVRTCHFRTCADLINLVVAGARSLLHLLPVSVSLSLPFCICTRTCYSPYDDRAYTSLVTSSSVGASPAAGWIERRPKHRTVQENHTSIFQAVWECT